MKILDPNDDRKLRGLIARALDDGASEPEKHNSALAACRLLARYGLGVDGESEDQLAIISPKDMVPSPGFAPPAVVFVREQWNASDDPRKRDYEANMNSIFDEFFGGGAPRGFDDNKFGGRGGKR